MTEQTFTSFLYNRKNAAAVEAAENFARGAGPLSLVISGSPGSGKTHLLRAVQAILLATHPPALIFCGSFEDWKALDHPYFLRYILMDDVTAAQAADIFRPRPERPCLAVIRNGQNMAGLYTNTPRACFTHFRLADPDLGIRIQYLRREIFQRGINLANEDILNLALRHNNLAALEKWLHGGSVPAGYPAPPLSPEKIIQQVAIFFQLNPEDIKGKNREKKLNLARHTAMFLCRDMLGVDLKSIGNCFQGKNHASVLYSINKINILCKSNKNMHKLVTELKKKLSQAPLSGPAQMNIKNNVV